MKPKAKLSQQAGPTYEEMHRTLFEAITELRLSPGMKLREDDLTEAFGVSRTRIRTVLQKLNHLGVVELHPFRGAFVAEPSATDAREVFEARRIVESGILLKVMDRITPANISELRDTLAKESEAIGSGNRSAAIRHSGDFHIQLCDLLGNRTLTEQLRGLVSRTSLIIAVYPPSGVAACDTEHHGILMERIEAGDTPGAIDALHADLDATERSLALENENGSSVDLREIVATFAARYTKD